MYYQKFTKYDATGVVFAATTKKTIGAIILVGGSADSSVVIRETDASGTTRMTIKAKAGETAPPIIMCSDFTGMHITLSGTGAEVYIGVI